MGLELGLGLGLIAALWKARRAAPACMQAVTSRPLKGLGHSSVEGLGYSSVEELGLGLGLGRGAWAAGTV